LIWGGAAAAGAGRRGGWGLDAQGARVVSYLWN
jgi:hypothetical protein